MSEIKPLTIRLSDATAVSGIGRSSFYRLIKEGQLSDVVGRRLIYRDELEQLMNEGTSER